MASILETIMLLSFGFSWPMTVIKNIQAKSTKGMSLPFFILIILGYVCGIVAKFLTGQVNYVLAAYILNIVLVGSNIIIYIRNLKYDKQNEVKEAKPAKSKIATVA